MQRENMSYPYMLVATDTLMQSNGRRSLDDANPHHNSPPSSLLSSLSFHFVSGEPSLSPPPKQATLSVLDVARWRFLFFFLLRLQSTYWSVHPNIPPRLHNSFFFSRSIRCISQNAIFGRNVALYVGRLGSSRRCDYYHYQKGPIFQIVLTVDH